MNSAFRPVKAGRPRPVAPGPHELPVNIRQAVYLAASILRRMSGKELDFHAMEGLIKGNAKTCGGSR